MKRAAHEGSSGYSQTRQHSETIAAALHEAATLIGPPGAAPLPLPDGEPLRPGLGMDSEAALLERRARDLHEGLFKVIVYGEFKHGKSTLLNAMLGSRLLPAKTLKCTAIISVLVYGERDDVAVYRSDSSAPELYDRETFGRTFQLTAADEETLNDQGYVDRFKDIAYAQIECRSPLCANGVRLVDSPGLGDHPSRTRVTTRYLRESHAVIFMLNAMRLLSDDEKDFIRSTFRPGRMDNVFFVVNRVNQINPHEVEEVRGYFRGFLAPYYRDERGDFDEALYARRVFFINALGALEARSATPPDAAALEASGVAALEGELEHFLTSDQKHRAALDESAQSLGLFVDEALQAIDQQKALQDVPLEQFEQTLDAVGQHLHQLEQRKGEIERTIQRFGDMVGQKITADLQGYVYEMRDTWRHDSQDLTLDEVSFGAVAASFFQGFIDKEAAQQRIAVPIRREVERYMQQKTRAWSEHRVPAAIQPDIDTLMDELEAQVVEFKVELERTGMLVTPAFAPDAAQDRARFSQWARSLIASTLHDITGVEGAVTEWGNWSSLLWRAVQQAVLIYLLVSFSGPVGWTIFAVAQVALLFWSEQQFRQRLLQKIGEELHQNLQRELPGMQHDIYRDVTGQFTRMAQSLTDSLQQQIDEKRREMARILEQKRDLSFSAAQEKQRLDAIGARLLALREAARTAASAE